MQASTQSTDIIFNVPDAQLLPDVAQQKHSRPTHRATPLLT
jgi:hypothetical protein